MDSAFVQRISEGALSPDGTVLATASHDGYVKFWQIYIEGQDQPRYMYKIYGLGSSNHLVNHLSVL